VRAGWAGLIAAGASFIVPAMLITMALAWAYVRFGSTPEAGWLLYGVKPVVIAIIAQALWGLGQKAVKGPLTAAVGLAVLVLYFIGINELVLLFAGGLLVMAAENLGRFRKSGLAGMLVPVGGLSLPALAAAPFSMPLMFLTFLKIGRCCTAAGTCCWPFCAPILWCGWVGLRTSSWWMRLPSGR